MKKCDEEYCYVAPEWSYLVLAFALILLLIIVYALKIPERIALSRTYSALFALKLCVLLLIYEYSESFYISASGIRQCRFGIKLRYIPWENVDQVGTGRLNYNTAAIVVTLKNCKRYTPLKESGRVRDLSVFAMLHPKGTIVIRKSPETLSFIKKVYGELDYEWIPPDFK